MRKTLKLLLAAACILLAVAVAFLIYLEFGRQDAADPAPKVTEPSSSSSEAATVPDETTVSDETTVPDETELVPETQEGGMPVFPFDQENDSGTAPTEGDPDATEGTEGTYVPDEDELPQMPL